MASPIREMHEIAVARRRKLAFWFAQSLVVLALLSVAVAHVTGGARVFLRFSPVFGLICGAAMGWLALQNGRPMGRGRWAFPALLVGISFVGLTLEAHRIHVVKLRAKYDTPIPSPTPEMAASFQQKREAVLAAEFRFGAYLSYRVSKGSLRDGRLSAVAWPAIFWAGEIVLAGLVGGWSFNMVTRQPQPAEAATGDDKKSTAS